MAADRYSDDPYWKTKPLTPAQLMVQDIGIEAWRPGKPPRLEINEVPASSLFAETTRPQSDKSMRTSESVISLRSYGSTGTEQHRLEDLQREYWWMNRLRRPESNTQGSTCRWIHIYSKFPEYLHGALVGLSDWTADPQANVAALRQLDRCIYDHERFSKHGKYFSPFFRPLTTSMAPPNDETPLFLSLPFMDWTTYPGPTPPNRFLIDQREGRASARSASHPLRSILQHFYRLEDTKERERTQVYHQHRPWYGDREVDLKVRQWYGHYPTGLVVDELWLLVVDSRHIITFSANQTWKARWPPLQLTSRISDVSFRGIRDNFFSREQTPKYSARTHAICCIHGAVGMLHRGFWLDMPAPCSDRYGGYLSRLQYRLHRSPNTKLVTDLLQIHDELNIVLQLTRQQEEVIAELRQFIGTELTFIEDPNVQLPNPERYPSDERIPSSEESPVDLPRRRLPNPYEIVPSSRELENRYTAPPRVHYAWRPLNPIDEMLDLLKREYDDLRELRDSSNDLVTRTVQLVNVRLEDHGRAVLIFTVVTIVFLPLSFTSSYFGMNIKGVKDSNQNTKEYWVIAALTTLGTVVLSLLFAFWGGHAMERFYSKREVDLRSKSAGKR